MRIWIIGNGQLEKEMIERKNTLHLNLHDANNSFIVFWSENDEVNDLIKDVHYYLTSDTTPSIDFVTNETKFNGSKLKTYSDDIEFGEIELEFVVDEYYEVWKNLFKLGMKFHCRELVNQDKSIASLNMIQHITNNDSKTILKINYNDIIISNIGEITHTYQDGMTELNLTVSFEVTSIEIDDD